MLAPSGGGLILYQAYGNLYAMTGRKAHLLEDKQIPSVGVFDENIDLSGVASCDEYSCDDMRVASIGGGSVVARLGVGRSELESQREREQRERERARGMRARVDRRGGREKREERDEEREKAEESRERGPRGDRAREIEDRVNEREKRLERVQGEQKQTNRAMRRRRDRAQA
ncbi:hypothetical protein Tco_0336111 [Tanacetum coccineum]